MNSDLILQTFYLDLDNKEIPSNICVWKEEVYKTEWDSLKLTLLI